MTMLFNKKFHHPLIGSVRVYRALGARYHAIWGCESLVFAVILHSWMTRQMKLWQFSGKYMTHNSSFPLFLWPLLCRVWWWYSLSPLFPIRIPLWFCSQSPSCCWVQLKPQGHNCQGPDCRLTGLGWTGPGLAWCLHQHYRELQHDPTKMNTGFWWDDLHGVKNINLCAVSNKTFPHLPTKQPQSNQFMTSEMTQTAIMHHGL